jgi:hypothetical protein
VGRGARCVACGARVAAVAGGAWGCGAQGCGVVRLLAHGPRFSARGVQEAAARVSYAARGEAAAASPRLQAPVSRGGGGSYLFSSLPAVCKTEDPNF